MPRYPEYQIHDLDTYGYGRIIQTIDGKFYDGWGNTVVFTLFGQEVSINVEGVKEDSTDGGNVNVTNTDTNNTTNTDLFKDLQDQINSLKDQLNTQLSGASYVLPGTIVMWGGSVTGIPTGWAICDGRVLYDLTSPLRKQLIDQGNPFGSWDNSPILPDLRERFVVGAGGNNNSVIGSTYNVGDKGGVINNKLNISNIPEHQHYYEKFVETISTSTGKVQDGIYSQKTFINGVTANKTPFYPQTLGKGDYVIGYDDYWGHPDKERSYGISSAAAPGWYRDYGNPKADSDGWVENDPLAIENRPPYFALCFIIKL
jgi:microcystin-dependent protein